jgi:hypothetical protein
LLITLDPQIFICGFFVLILTIKLKQLYMESIVVTLTDAAAKSFQKDLRANAIAYQGQVGTSYYFLENSPKLRMAIQLVKERFGSRAITVKPLD